MKVKVNKYTTCHQKQLTIPGSKQPDRAHYTFDETRSNFRSAINHLSVVLLLLLLLIISLPYIYFYYDVLVVDVLIYTK